MATRQDRTNISAAKIIALSAIAVALVGGIFALLEIATKPAPASTIKSTTLAPLNRQLLQAIEFNYADDPTKHGWQLSEGTTITFSHLTAGQYGNVLKIESPDWYALDLSVGPAAQFGSRIEYAIRSDEYAPIYAKIKIQRGNGALSQDAWLNFSPGSGQPRIVEQDHEWAVFVAPTQIQQDGWLQFQIDLEEKFKETFGKKGWGLDRLIGVRIRGNQTLAYIHIYK